VRNGRNLVHQAAFSERGKADCEDRFLVAAFGMAKARQNGFAIEHHGGIGREYQIRQIGCGLHSLHSRTGADQRIVERRPLALRLGMQLAIAGPGPRVHPRIDAVGHGEMARRAHQEPRPCAGLGERRVNVHCDGLVPSAGAARLESRRREFALPDIWC